MMVNDGLMMVNQWLNLNNGLTMFNQPNDGLTVSLRTRFPWKFVGSKPRNLGYVWRNENTSGFFANLGFSFSNPYWTRI